MVAGRDLRSRSRGIYCGTVEGS
uniref:Uncharacterized protein n=1 Tax=Anopheles arabiensis TaxID=7173 RepID=A0A182IH07_ANOAR